MGDLTKDKGEKMKDVDFLLLYEHKSRELENVTLIKYELERRGYRVLISRECYSPRIPSKAQKIKAKVAVVCFMYNDKSIYPIVRGTTEVTKIVNFQWEQVLSPLWNANGFHIPSEQVVKATHLCWGECNYNKLKEQDLRHLSIVGPVHMDFLRGEFKDYYLGKTEIINQFQIKTKKVALYISSFAMASMSKKSKKSASEHLNINFCDLDLLANNSATSQKATLQWFDKVLQETKDCTIVYRPHPAEATYQLLQEMMRKHDNFKVISDYSVKQWIMVADKVFTWFSTSIVEAYFAKKSCHILRPVPIPKEIDSEIYEGAKFIETYEGFKEEFFREETKQEVAIDEALVQKHYNVTETPSYIRVCDVLEETLQGSDMGFDWDKLTQDNKVYLKKTMRQSVLYYLKFNFIYRINRKLPLTLFKFNKRLHQKTVNFYAHMDRILQDIATQEEMDEIMRNIKHCLDKEQM